MQSAMRHRYRGLIIKANLQLGVLRRVIIAFQELLQASFRSSLTLVELEQDRFDAAEYYRYYRGGTYN